jgi:hypothetical protein
MKMSKYNKRLRIRPVINSLVAEPRYIFECKDWYGGVGTGLTIRQACVDYSRKVEGVTLYHSKESDHTVYPVPVNIAKSLLESYKQDFFEFCGKISLLCKKEELSKHGKIYYFADSSRIFADYERGSFEVLNHGNT